MNNTTEEFALSVKPLEGYLLKKANLIIGSLWTIQEMLWIYQLDRDGFLISKIKFSPSFLKELFMNNVDFVSLKDQSEYYILVTQNYIALHPEVKYSSQLRPDF